MNGTPPPDDRAHQAGGAGGAGAAREGHQAWQARRAIEEQHDQLDPQLSSQFLLALGDGVSRDGLTPSALADAAARVLPVDGAGLSMLVNVLRLPLGASTADARAAEELQSTLGEGPCLDAAQAQATVVADDADLETTWPLYAEELNARTPFRSVAAIPLKAPGHGVYAALDLYSTDTDLSTRLDLHQAVQVATVVAGLLTTCIGQVPDLDTAAPSPDWYRQAASRRHQVWVALGMIMGTRGLRTRDALALLRAHAYTRGRSLDDIADDVAEHRLDIEDLT